MHFSLPEKHEFVEYSLKLTEILSVEFLTIFFSTNLNLKYLIYL